MTLLEVLIALAMIAIVAAVVYPTVAGQLRTGQTAALGNQLVNLRDAIASFQENVGAYPRLLTELTSAPVAGDDDSCAADLSGAERNAWRGPYINQAIVGAMPVGDASVQVTMVRVPATTAATQAGVLQIQATGVASDVATDLESRFDGNADLTAGNIVWTSASGGTLTFQIPIRGC
jgi:prepilin-type N-terminal cleavage/methylation domain-containing protein